MYTPIPVNYCVLPESLLPVLDFFLFLIFPSLIFLGAFIGNNAVPAKTIQPMPPYSVEVGLI